MSVTVIDVAKEAGVSRTTVSNVFNGRAKFSPETREAVLAAAKKLGYKPNLAAKSLITNRSCLIGLILPSYVDKNTLTSSPFYNIIIDAIYSVLQHEAYYDVIIFCVPDEEGLLEAATWIDSRNIDGIIAIGQYETAFIEELDARAIPVVLIDSYQTGFANILYINSADEEGGYLATRKLIENEYQRIAYATISVQSPVMQQRYAGYQRAIREAGYPEFLFTPDDLAFEAGNQLGQTLLAEQIDGLFCSEDMLALGVLHALLRQGVKVGSEFGLVGFDNIQNGRQVFPELTTIDQNILRKGEIATQTLLQVLHGEEPVTKQLILPVQLIARDTTR